MFERLRDEHGFTGGYSIVKDYMRQRERRGREMFVPLAHPPGHAQADFGEAVVVIDSVEQKAHFFVMDLPRSDACFVRAYTAATAEAWIDGHVHAFTFFGKVPASILYDNDRCLVAKILPYGTRKRATLFSGFLSHYLFRDRYDASPKSWRQVLGIRMAVPPLTAHAIIYPRTPSSSSPSIPMATTKRFSSGSLRNSTPSQAARRWGEPEYFGQSRGGTARGDDPGSSRAGHHRAPS